MAATVVDAEPVDAEPIDAEPTDIEPTDAEATPAVEAVPTIEAAEPVRSEPVPVPAGPLALQRTGTRMVWLDRARTHRWLVLAAILLAIVLVATIGIALAVRANRPAPRQAAGPVATTQPGGAQPGGQPSAGATQPGTAGGTAPSPGTAPGTQNPTQPAQPGTGPGSALPTGWHYYHDPTGFTVAVPDGWTMFRRNGIVYFRDSAWRLFGIDQSNQPRMDPVADWVTQEKRRVAAGDFPGYEPLGIRHVDYHVTAADWEFRYNGNGGRLHVINRGAVFSDHQAYGFYWETPDDQWQANLANFDLITRTFQGRA
ncbi:MAG: hypothetical protein AUI14_22715 [Actinobacteria bacterium 13_2_20CM_2_71_6]|nr:MAG: hypothetical protein AUI14_22715 [Actinobacteria bacterium 13_2_20CM_2_71_6]